MAAEGPGAADRYGHNAPLGGSQRTAEHKLFCVGGAVLRHAFGKPQRAQWGWRSTGWPEQEREATALLDGVGGALAADTALQSVHAFAGLVRDGFHQEGTVDEAKGSHKSNRGSLGEKGNDNSGPKSRRTRIFC